MARIGDVEVEGLEEVVEIDKDGLVRPAGDCVLTAVEPPKKPARPRLTHLSMLPEDLHGLVERAAVTTGIGPEDLARLLVARVLGGREGLAKELLAVAKEAHAERLAAVERELGEGVAG